MALRSFLGSLFARGEQRVASQAPRSRACRSVEDVRKAEASARNGRQDALGRLVETLKSEQQELQWAAQSALARLGMRAFDSLASALCSPDSDLALGAKLAFLEAKDAQLARGLAPLLSSGDDRVRWHVAGILRALKDPEAIGWLLPCLGDPSHLVRVEAVASLKALGWQPTTDEEKAVCAVAVEHSDVVTGKYKDAIAMGTPVVGPLSVALLTGNWVMAEHAARALAQVGDEAALSPLESALSWDTRERGLSFGNAQREALVGIVTILARLERLTPRTDEDLAPVLSAPDSIARSAPLEHVRAVADLKVGDVIRVWHDLLDRWATGWLEVMRLHDRSDLVCLRTWPDKTLVTRGIHDTVGSAWRWPMR